MTNQELKEKLLEEFDDTDFYEDYIDDYGCSNSMVSEYRIKEWIEDKLDALLLCEDDIKNQISWILVSDPNPQFKSHLLVSGDINKITEAIIKHQRDKLITKE